MQPKESKTNAHFNYSIIKSSIRMMAGAGLAMGYIWWAGILLIIAEVFGIVEEI